MNTTFIHGNLTQAPTHMERTVTILGRKVKSETLILSGLGIGLSLGIGIKLLLEQGKPECSENCAE